MTRTARLHDGFWTLVTAVTLVLLLVAAVAWFVRADNQQSAQLRAACERGNDLRAYAATDNAIALQLDDQLARRATDPSVRAAGQAAAVQRRELARFLAPIDCGRTIR